MNDYYYNSRQVAALFGVALETIRNWGSEFQDYLSPLANPGQGRHRKYSAEDLTVLALVRELKEKGLSYADVHTALRNGERGQPPELAPNQVQAIVVSERERRMALEVQTLQATVAQLQQRLADAEAAQKEAEELRRKTIILETHRRAPESPRGSIAETTRQLEEARKRIEFIGREWEAVRQGLLDALERRGTCLKMASES